MNFSSGSACLIERDEYLPRLFNHSPPFGEHGLDFLFFGRKFDHTGGVNDRLVTGRPKSHGLGISLDRYRDRSANPCLFNHLSTQINTITLTSLIPQLRYDQAMTRSNYQYRGLNFRPEAADTGQVKVAILHLGMKWR